MLDDLSNLWQTLSEVRLCLKQSYKSKGNKFYSVKEKDSTVNLIRTYELFKAKLTNYAVSSTLRDKLNKLDKDITTIRSEETRQNKTALIDKLELFWPSLEVEFEKEKFEMKSKIFSDELVKNLGTPFTTELKDFALVYGKSGTLTAFLLRKMLEKTLVIVLRKGGMSDDDLKDKHGKCYGLNNLLAITNSKKINGQALLTTQTYEKISGIKFLGDTSAHNPFVNVEMEEIVPQMPFIIVALKELARFL